jgi:hypothetical protein
MMSKLWRIVADCFAVGVALGLAAACSETQNGGATGAAPARYMGERANVSGTANGSTGSSSVLEQRIKEDSANGATSGGGNTQY